MRESSLCRSQATSLLLWLPGRRRPRSPVTQGTSLAMSSTTAPQMSLTVPIAHSALAATVAVPSLSLSLAMDVAPQAVARTGLLLRVLLVVALLVRVLLLAVEIKTEMVGMVVKEVTTTEVLEETLEDRTLATDLKEARAMVAAQEMVVIPVTEALEASLVATQPEDKTVLVKEVTEPTVEAARVVPAKEVRIRALRGRAKVISPDALEQLARLPSAWVSRLRLEA